MKRGLVMFRWLMTKPPVERRHVSYMDHDLSPEEHAILREPDPGASSVRRVLSANNVLEDSMDFLDIVPNGKRLAHLLREARRGHR